MEFVKRHAFLLGLAAGLVVVGTSVFLIFHFAYRSDTGRLESTLRGTIRRATDLGRGPLYTAAHVEFLEKRADGLDRRYREIVDRIRRMGRARQPLVDGLLPRSTEFPLRHAFRAAYREKLGDFMKRLKAVNPVAPADATPAQIEALRKEAQAARMFAHPRSFVLPDWVDRPEAPDLEVCRLAQEDIWLMEDLVGVLARLNEDHMSPKEPGVRSAAVKELVEIRIGADMATLEGARATGGRRYRGLIVRRGEWAAAEGRAPCLTGRQSAPGFYLVLPWRLVVVAQANLAGELIRRLKGTESFLAVEAWRMRPVTKTSHAQYRDLVAYDREDYGPEGVVRLEIVGESLVFQLEGGRVTTLPGISAMPAPPTAEEGPEPDEM